MKSTYHHGDLKEELIKTGLRMIQKAGIEKLSLRKLAAECGVSEAAPYSHFKNKKELVLAIHAHTAEQLKECLKDAYEHTDKKDSPNAILNMGKAYVMFFIRYPEYYTFLFSQSDIHITLSSGCAEDDFPPFQYYRQKVYLVYRKEGMDEERIKYGVIAMWGKVHGIAAIAAMKGVEKDFEWENVLEKILVE